MDFSPKSTQNGRFWPQNGRFWPQNRPKIDPKSTQNGRFWPQNGHFWRMDTHDFMSSDGHFDLKMTIFDHDGHMMDFCHTIIWPPKSTSKIDLKFDPQKCSKMSLFAHHFFTHFWPILATQMAEIMAIWWYFWQPAILSYSYGIPFTLVNCNKYPRTCYGPKKVHLPGKTVIWGPKTPKNTCFYVFFWFFGPQPLVARPAMPQAYWKLQISETG